MSSESLRAGDSLGIYRIVAHLGSGGMGEVYLAEDPRLGRRVALKVLAPELARDAASLKRFEREARAASALNHPSILTIYDFGHECDRAFIVSELIDGQTLRDRLAGGPLPLREAIEIGVQVASALAVAHAAGIVHRDIKPENVMVRRDGLVKVLDFGLAKQVGPRHIDALAKTAERTTGAGLAVGTLHYMSPEQARGRPVDARSDIFSLGTMLYELVSGRAPFDGETGSHVLVSILETEPFPLADPALWPIVAKALRKDPAERYPSIDEMLADLRALGAKEPQPRVRMTRRTAIAGAIAAAVVVVLVLLAAFLMRDRGPVPRVPIAVADFDNQTGEKALDGLSGMLITSLEQSRRLSVMTRPRMFDTLRRLDKPDVARIDEAVGREVAQAEHLRGLVTASVTKLGNLYVIDMKMLDPVTNEYVFTGKEQGQGQERIPALLDRLAERLRLSVREAPGDVDAAKKEVARATTTNLEAYQHYFNAERLISQLQFDDAEAELQKSVALDPRFALAWARLAYVNNWNGRDAEARRFMASAQRFSDGLTEKERLIMNALDAQVANDIPRASALHRRVLEKFPDTKESIWAIGDFAMHQGDFKTARDYLQRTIDLDPGHGLAHSHLVLTGMQSGDLTRAVADARRYVREMPSVMAYGMLVGLLIATRSDDEALSLAREAAQRFPDNVDAATIVIAAHAASGDLADARAQSERLGTIPEARKRGLYESYLAALALEEGRYREAMVWMERSAEAGARNGHDYRALEARTNRALLLAQWGRREEARAVADAAASRETGASVISQIALFETYLILDDVESAEKIIRPQLSLDGRLPPILAAAKAMQRGDPRAAVDAMRGSPQDLLSMWYLARCALAAERFDVMEKIAKVSRGNFQAMFTPVGASPLLMPTDYFLGRIAEGRGDRTTAKKHYQKFLDGWRNAEPDIPELVDTKARLAKL